jgi:hypothetical protein
VRGYLINDVKKIKFAEEDSMQNSRLRALHVQCVRVPGKNSGKTMV